jgi:KDO2-lipid IV(A) lauroyltransferase
LSEAASTASDAPSPLRASERLAVGALAIGMAALRGGPSFLVYGLADLLVPMVALFAWRHERRVRRQGRGMLRNQRIVFRDGLTRRRSRRLLFAWARHMTHLVVDFCRIPRIDRDNLDRLAEVGDLERLRPLVAGGRGLICVTGHIGVWELCGHLASLKGFAVTAVSRPASSRPLESLLTSVRTSGGQKVLSKWGVLWSLKKALDRGEALGIVADEDTAEQAIFAPFLGTLAATTPTPAALHRGTGVPIAVLACHRVARGRYELRVWDVIRLPRTPDREADLLAITGQVNAALSRAILHAPEQWIWGSRRFRTRPPGEVPGPDGLPPVAA